MKGAFQANAFQNNCFQTGASRPGAGKRHKWPTDYLPEPAWEVKPHKAKPFRPVWDYPGFEKAKPQEAPRPRPLPPLPLSLLSAPAVAPGIPSLSLEPFEQYTVPNPLDMRDHLQRVQEESQVRAALAALQAMRAIK